MARIRTFIAVDIGDAIRSRVVALQQKLERTPGGVKWTEPDNLHLTLLFLGEVDKMEVLSICRLVEKESRKLAPFTMEIASLGAFPTPRRPKILWAGVTEGAEAIKDLHDFIEAPLVERGGYRREDRGYTPHLTLGRIGSEERDEAWSSIIAAHADWSAGSVTIDEVLVMSSELRRSGPVYDVMGRGRLEGKGIA